MANVQNRPSPTPVKAREEPEEGLREPELPGSEPPAALMGLVVTFVHGAVVEVVVLDPGVDVVVDPGVDVVVDPGEVVVVDDDDLLVVVVVLVPPAAVVVVVPPAPVVVVVPPAAVVVVVPPAAVVVVEVGATVVEVEAGAEVDVVESEGLVVLVVEPDPDVVDVVVELAGVSPVVVVDAIPVLLPQTGRVVEVVVVVEEGLVVVVVELEDVLDVVEVVESEGLVVVVVEPEGFVVVVVESEGLVVVVVVDAVVVVVVAAEADDAKRANPPMVLTTHAETVAIVERAALPISSPFVAGPRIGPPEGTYRSLHLEQKIPTDGLPVRHRGFATNSGV
jgi:hypothetical protein